MTATLNQRWAATIAGVLAARGVGHVVICPGSRSTPLALAFADRPHLKCWPCLDERSAAFLALGIAKGLQQPAAVVCTSGTAGAHFLPALLEAREGGTPLVVLTADRPSELHGFGAPQTIEQRGVFGAAVRAECSLPEPFEAGFDHLIASLSKVMASAVGAPRGPVHVNVPFREPLAHPDGLAGPVLSPSGPVFSSFPGVPELAVVKRAIAESTRGVIVVGPRERDDGLGEAVHRLGAALGFPVLAEAASNARFGFPDAIWAWDALVRSPRVAERLQPDLVLRFGGGLTLKQPQAWLDAARCRCFAFLDQGQPFDPQHRVETFFTGDVCAMAEALMDQGQASLRGVALEAQAKLTRILEASQGWNECLVARTVTRALPAQTSFFLSSSMPIRDVDAYAQSEHRLRVFSNRGVNGIDGIVSTAAGVAMARGPTVALVGDVAALHDLSGWLLARSLNAPLVVVVVNNDGGGIFSFLPVAQRTPHFERFFGTPHGVDFAHLAQLARASLKRPRTLVDLTTDVQDGLRQPGLHLIEVRTERASNVEAHRSLNAAMVAALEAP